MKETKELRSPGAAHTTSLARLYVAGFLYTGWLTAGRAHSPRVPLCFIVLPFAILECTARSEYLLPEKKGMADSLLLIQPDECFLICVCVFFFFF